MFDHLDDPAPPVATVDTRQAVGRRIDALRRRRTSQAAAALFAAVVVLGVLTLAAARDDEASPPAGRTGVEVIPPTTTTTTMRRPPVDVSGTRANVLKSTGPLDGWWLDFYPQLVDGRPAVVWLSVRDPDGPVPRLVSIDYGDGRIERPARPPCPPPGRQPVAERVGEHWFHSMRGNLDDAPPLWRHTYRPGDDLEFRIKVVFESGCGAARPSRSTAEFQVHVFRPWPGLEGY